MEPKKKRLRKRKLYQMEIDESLDNGVFAISLVEDPAIEELFVYMSKEHQMIKLAEVDKEKRILMGPVLIPNKEIPRHDDETGEEYSIVFTPAVVERAAQLFMQQQKNNNATIEHTEKSIPDVSVVESWIIADSQKDKSNVYGMNFPTGTWMAMMKINNEDVWQNYVKAGKVKGFSLEGLFGHLEVDAEWGIPDVPSTSSAQGYPNPSQFPPASTNNQPYDVPYSERQLAKLSKQADDVFGKELIEQVKAVLLQEEIALESYNDYPESVKNNAKRGIELNDAVDNKCATQVGKIRAQQLAGGEPVSLETIKRMYSYLSRAGEYYNESDSSACGTISYLLWGGKSALAWSSAKLKQLGAIELDSEVFMAQAALANIENAVQELKIKIGTDETDLPAWIQDHITNSENYITHANSNFYLEEDEEEEIEIELEVGVPHYFEDGTLYEGPTHKDAEGRLMTGAVHTEDSKFIYHKEELETATSISSSYAGQFGEPKKKKKNVA